MNIFDAPGRSYLRNMLSEVRSSLPVDSELYLAALLRSNILLNLCQVSACATNVTLSSSCQTPLNRLIHQLTLYHRIYLSTSCAFVTWWGWDPMLSIFVFSHNWPYHTPRVFMLLLWVTAATLGAALFIMASWQLLLISRGETSVEASDNGTSA